MVLRLSLNQTKLTVMPNNHLQVIEGVRLRNVIAGRKRSFATWQQGRVRHGRPGPDKNGTGLVRHLSKKLK